MARWEQYEVWARQGEEWTLVGSFIDFEIAAAVARARRERVRLLRVVFEDSTRAEERVLLEIGASRKAG